MGILMNVKKTLTTALNSHAPKKVKVLRGNHKPHLNKASESSHGKVKVEKYSQ